MVTNLDRFVTRKAIGQVKVNFFFPQFRTANEANAFGELEMGYDSYGHGDRDLVGQTIHRNRLAKENWVFTSASAGSASYIKQKKLLAFIQMSVDENEGIVRILAG